MEREEDIKEILREKGVSFRQLEGMTVGEVKKLTEDYKEQIRRLNK